MTNKKSIHDFSCQIKFNILLDLDLSANEIRLFGLIESMQHNTGSVFFSNKYLSELLKVSVRAVQLMSKNLKDKGYIEKLWVPEKKKHCWFVKGEAQLHPPMKQSFAKGLNPSFTHIANNINTISKGNFAHATSTPKTYNPNYQDYVGRIKTDIELGLLPEETVILSQQEFESQS